MSGSGCQATGRKGQAAQQAPPAVDAVDAPVKTVLCWPQTGPESHSLSSHWGSVYGLRVSLLSNFLNFNISLTSEYVLSLR